MIEYVEKSLDEVLQYYAKDFRPKIGQGEIFQVDTFVDQYKQRVLFRIYVGDEQPKLP